MPTPASPAGPPPPAPAPLGSSFAEQLVRIEEIVRRLETEELDLDEALRLFEDGVERLRVARERLTAAEAKVRQIRVDDLDTQG
ncbi:MAG: exodeoxyribonuclease VII small subunit [Gemmatimonadales bacterium]